jgi:hypothetical protein
MWLEIPLQEQDGGTMRRFFNTPGCPAVVPVIMIVFATMLALCGETSRTVRCNGKRCACGIIQTTRQSGFGKE